MLTHLLSLYILALSTDPGLTEEEVLLENALAEDQEAEHAVQRATLVLRLKEGMGSLTHILKVIENFKGSVVHLESRPSKAPPSQFDILVKIDITKPSLLQLIRSMRQNSALAGVTLLNDNSQSIKGE